VIRKLLITSVQIILNKTSQNKSQSTLLPNTSVQRYHYTNLFLYIPYQKLTTLHIRICIALPKRLQWTMYC